MRVGGWVAEPHGTQYRAWLQGGGGGGGGGRVVAPEAPGATGAAVAAAAAGTRDVGRAVRPWDDAA